MPEHNIIISVDEYRELVAKAEQIKSVERLLKSGAYVSVKEVAAILAIDFVGGESIG